MVYRLAGYFRITVERFAYAVRMHESWQAEYSLILRTIFWKQGYSYLVLDPCRMTAVSSVEISVLIRPSSPLRSLAISCT